MEIGPPIYIKRGKVKNKFLEKLCIYSKILIWENLL